MRVPTLAWNSSTSGLLKMKRSVPPTEPAPYSVPWGPRSTSTRSRSLILRFVKSGVLSMYVDTPAGGEGLHVGVDRTLGVGIEAAQDELVIDPRATDAQIGIGDARNDPREIGQVCHTRRPELFAAERADVVGDFLRGLLTAGGSHQDFVDRF